MRNALLHGFYLDDLLIEPLTRTVTGPAFSEHLPPKATEILLCLASDPGSLVSRDELLRDVWGDGNGSHEGLSHAVSELRHALGDHHNDPTFIQTVPTRGYRLVVQPRLIRNDRNIPSKSESTDANRPPLILELIKRGVVHAGVAYLIVGWMLVQVADTTFQDIGLPPWAEPFITFTVIGGFPIVLLLAWFIEYAEGRFVLDKGKQSGRIFSGISRNYLTVVAAYVIAAFATSAYQYAVGFPTPQIEVAAQTDQLQTEIPVVPNSIAVLQFLNIDGSETARIFSDGLGEDVLDKLAKIPGLRVSARGDAWQLPVNASSDIVRRRLRVAYYLEGSVRLIQNQLRVVVQLIDSANGFHIFSKSFDRDLNDFRSVQKEITELTVANLRVALPAETQSIYALEYDDTDVDAYVLYRKGKEVLERPRTLETLDDSMNLFTQALDVDPDFAAAHAGLCTAQIRLYSITHDVQDIKIAEQACDAALSASPRLHVVHTALGGLYMSTGRYAEAEKAYRNALLTNAQDVRAILGLAGVAQQQQQYQEAEQLYHEAIDLQPGNWRSINRFGGFLFSVGRYQDAAEQYRRVVYLDPQNYVTLGNLGTAQMMAGNFQAALPAIQRSLEIETDQTIYSNLGIIYYYLGQFDESVEIHMEVIELSPNSGSSRLNLADALHFAGDESGARQAFEKTIELTDKNLSVNPSDSESIYVKAWATAMIGDIDTARQLIDRSIELSPSDPYVRYYDALLKTRTGDFDAALDAVEQAVDMGYPIHVLSAEPYLNELQKSERFRMVTSSAK